MFEHLDAAQSAARRPPRVPATCKLGFHYYDEPRGDTKVGYAVPALRLHGRWLEAGGFRVGETVDVSIADGVLLLSRQAAPAAPPAPAAPVKRRRRAP